MKRSAIYFILFSCIFASIVREAKSQVTLNALTPSLPYAPPGGSYLEGPYFQGYDIGGVGWTFTPTENILVTDVSAVLAPQVSIWLGTSQILASYNITTSDGNPESISPLLLLAGQNYAVSAQNPNFTGTTMYLLGSPTGASSLPLVTVSSYLTEFGNFNLSSTGQWTPIGSTDNTDYVSIGPNFQFQVVPEPRIIRLSILGFLFCVRKFKLLT